MAQCTRSRFDGEAGSLLIEAIVAVAIVSICAGSALAGVAAISHATAHALPASALVLAAQNVVTDVRAATAYDPIQLAGLAGRSTSFDVDAPLPDGSVGRVHIVASVTRAARTDAYTATVTARAPNAPAQTIQATLVQEAPAPGSIQAATNADSPSGTCRSQCGDDPDPIVL